MTSRTYGQFCGVARALEIVGQRWALLVVRDLILSPKRFTDLRRGLPQIPTNVLSARLKELEEAGIVRRHALPRPEASVVYELTDYGRGLEDVVLRLGRWGARSLTEPRPDEVLNTDSLVLALRATFQPEAAHGLHAAYELHLGDIVVHAVVNNGALDAAAGPLEKPDMVLQPGPALKALMAGEMSPDDAVQGGLVQFTGAPALLARFVQLFHVDPAPATPGG